jgi:imidazole glycerol-phosphate synthase subunit HisF
VDVPVIASGGAGTAKHIGDALEVAGADAALVAGIFHDGLTTVGAVKTALRERHIPVRFVA